MMDYFFKHWPFLTGSASIGVWIVSYIISKVLEIKIFQPLNQKQTNKLLRLIVVLTFSYGIVVLTYGFLTDLSGGQVTVVIHGLKGIDDFEPVKKGRVRLFFADTGPTEEINPDGRVTFKQVPRKFFESDVKVKIIFIDLSGKNYKVLKPDSLYTLKKEETIFVAIKLFGIEQLKGTVKDKRTNEYIDSARVAVPGCCHTFSDIHGEFKLQIPDSFQYQYQYLKVEKDEYVPFEDHKVRVQSDSDYPVGMTKLNKGKKK